MEKNNVDENIRQTAKDVKESLLKEIPILEQNLNSLQNSYVFAILPISIHNICIIFERQAHKFIKPALSLYIHMDKKSIKSKEIRQMLYDTIKRLRELRDKEDNLYKQQYDVFVRQTRKYLKSNNSRLSEKDRVEQVRLFNHLEADMSSFYQKLIALYMSGFIDFNERQTKILDDVRNLCIDIIKDAIPQKKNALENIEKVLRYEK